MNTLTWEAFEAVELRTGTIIEVTDFPEAKIPAYIVTVDFGEFGIKRSSSRIVDLYTKDELLEKQIVGVTNFPPKKIGPFMSEFLVTGFYREDKRVVLAVPDKHIQNGAKLG